MVGGKAVVGVLGRKVGKKLEKVGRQAKSIALVEGYNPRNTTG